MKKILTTVLIFLSLLSFSQTKDYTIEGTVYVKTDSLLIIKDEVVDLDTTTIANGQVLQRVSGIWVNSTLATSGYDSIVFSLIDGYFRGYSGGAVVDSTIIDGRYVTYDSLLVEVNTNTLVIGDSIYFEEGGNRTITIESGTGSGGDNLIIEAGSDDDGLGGGQLRLKGGGGHERGNVVIGDSVPYSGHIEILDSVDMHSNKIIGLASGTKAGDAVEFSQLATSAKSTYSIILPSATTVAARIVTPTSLPAGWTLSASGLDLIITHNLGRWAANVTVFAEIGVIIGTGTPRQQLFNTNAYNGITSSSDDVLRIYSLSTVAAPIIIFIIFE